MNKRVLFAAGAIALLAGACGAKTSVNTQTQTNTPAPQASPMSLKDLMAGGGAKTCTVTFAENNVSSQGTIHLAGGKMSGDFTATVNGKAQTSHMINDGTTVYTWVDGMASGFKMTVDVMKANKPSSTPQSSNQPKSIDQDAKYQYNCSSWTVDSSVFTPPSSVKFSDFSSMMLQIAPPTSAGAKASGGVSGSASACAACANAGAGKTQCLATLHCAQ